MLNKCHHSEWIIYICATNKIIWFNHKRGQARVVIGVWDHWTFMVKVIVFVIGNTKGGYSCLETDDLRVLGISKKYSRLSNIGFLRVIAGFCKFPQELMQINFLEINIFQVVVALFLTRWLLCLICHLGDRYGQCWFHYNMVFTNCSPDAVYSSYFNCLCYWKNIVKVY